VLYRSTLKSNQRVIPQPRHQQVVALHFATNLVPNHLRLSVTWDHLSAQMPIHRQHLDKPGVRHIPHKTTILLQTVGPMATLPSLMRSLFTSILQHNLIMHHLPRHVFHQQTPNRCLSAKHLHRNTTSLEIVRPPMVLLTGVHSSLIMDLLPLAPLNRSRGCPPHIPINPGRFPGRI
jgi:hypothetical protein